MPLRYYKITANKLISKIKFQDICIVLDRYIHCTSIQTLKHKKILSFVLHVPNSEHHGSNIIVVWMNNSYDQDIHNLKTYLAVIPAYQKWVLFDKKWFITLWTTSRAYVW